jgi:hypothetical protein
MNPNYIDRKMIVSYSHHYYHHGHTISITIILIISITIIIIINIISLLTSISFYSLEMPPHGPGQSGSTHSHNSEYPDDAWNLYAW